MSAARGWRGVARANGSLHVNEDRGTSPRETVHAKRATRIVDQPDAFGKWEWNLRAREIG
ncbi:MULTISPECIES: hypothetical protein [Burkholderia]|uniref:Uncharacterized protein n=1 Tax=Burkholderia humptydooensis TaxID=430531 RepID=A0A7U4PAS5_9BURK|nr:MULTISPECIES: hypothetical protein [Burkholderia]ATF33049.1 hypothetical protein CO709_06595 [Burkholderia thailandensis]ALX46077.1 hypothetical protein AQ610_27150 [Burkholderia humptydooensis]KST70769.1 hypothetical protein WS76_19245 [Burkholderia humptydooensis]KVN16880.1 hypothetical protein WT08_05455 [Burkholderia sp. MSMB1552]KWZ51280.1 hypothetical protein WS92_28765 [Burkholderia sp. MSMB1588]